MNPQSFYYSVEPKFADVSKEEYVKFINSYPRSLYRDVFAACNPPSVTYNDFELADRWPYSIVASTLLYNDTPGSYFYKPEEERVYQIMVNYKEVFDSRTGNKTID